MSDLRRASGSDAAAITTRALTPEYHRELPLDRFRGALVILMVAGNQIAGVQSVPAYLKHAPDVGLTIADTVAPAFVFVIGMTFGASFERRMRFGGLIAVRHFLLRYLALIGIGAVIAAGATDVAGQPTTWGVLQALGVAGLLALAVIRLAWWARATIGLAVLLGYEWLLASGARESVIEADHGGLIGALSWAALLMLSTAVADIRRRGRRAYTLCCAVLVLAAALAAVVVPVSKHRVSLSFVLVTLALAAVALLITELGARLVAARPGLVSWWGENALVLYFAHLLILGAIAAPGASWWYADAPFWLATVQVAGTLALMSVIAWWLHRRGRRIVL